MRTSEMRAGLRRLISGEVLWDKEIISCYSVDSSSYMIRPKAVAFPKNKEEVRRIIEFASENKIVVTPRGGSTGLVGSAVGGGIIVDCKNLRKIRAAGNCVIVESGASKGRLDAELQKKAKFLGPNPSVGPYCTLGGMIATNASGSRSLKYGSMLDNVLEIEFVDGRGNLVRLPGDSKLSSEILRIARRTDKGRFPRVSKNSCGYRLDAVTTVSDAHKILAGSEGTLGVIISAKLRTYDCPKARCLAVFGYGQVRDAIKDCKRILRAGPAALEFVDENTLKNMDRAIPKGIKCLLLVEFDENLERAKRLTGILGGRLVESTFDETEIRKWWKYRDSSLSFSLRDIQRSEKSPHIIEDAAVPVEKLGRLVSLIGNINKKFGSRSIVYGHAGDGNLHVRLITRQKKKDVLRDVARTYFFHVNKLGGTISAEHGDGLARTEFVRQQYGDRVYSEFRQLKRLLDPGNILNAGKIVSGKSRTAESLTPG